MKMTTFLLANVIHYAIQCRKRNMVWGLKKNIMCSLGKADDKFVIVCGIAAIFIIVTMIGMGVLYKKN